MTQGCAAGGCYYQQPVGGCAFECTVTSGPGLDVGAVCSALNDCRPGLVCLGDVPGCAAGSFCCTDYCRLGGAACAHGTCRAAFTPPLPAGLENVGACLN